MTLDPAALLAGPRGRRLCLELLLDSRRPTDDDDPRRTAGEAVGWASRALEANPGVLLVMGDDRDFVEPVVTVDDAAAALAAVPLPHITEESLRDALADSVAQAMYWQPPHGRDVLAAEPAFRPVLERVARAIVASPHATWWSSPVALAEQWSVPWDGAGTTDDPERVLATWAEDVRAEEARAEQERPTDASANWSGTWWSTPPSALTHTTRSLGEDGPAELWFVEDSLGWEAVTATPVLPASARVLEIDGADAWIALCRRHPLVVTASRRHDWFRVTGRDGGWVQPDWQAVAGAYDGVHLTVEGYLSAATRLLDVSEGWASIIAGWAPDATYWFARTLSGGQPESWLLVDDEWRRG